MSAARDGWYVADADGEADGPLAREVLARYAQRGDLDTLTVWHLDWSEWRPLRAVVGAGVAAAAGARDAASLHANAATGSGMAKVAAAVAAASAMLPPELAAKQQELKERLRQKLEQQKATRGGAVARDAVRAAREELRESMRDGKITQAELRDAARAASSAGIERSKDEARAGADRAKAAAAAKAAEGSARLGQAFRRLFARLVDTLTIGMLAALPIGAVLLAERPWVSVAPMLPFIALWLMIPLEALFLASGGSTPGKALFGLRVVDARGRALGFGPACARGFHVLMRGMAFGIPVVSLVFVAAAGGPLLKDGRTSWDARLGTRIEARPMSATNWQLGLVALFCAWALLGTGLWFEALDWLAQEIAATPQ
jgi:uncharacterized RDD family membrane protein YckC